MITLMFFSSEEHSRQCLSCYCYPEDTHHKRSALSRSTWSGVCKSGAIIHLSCTTRADGHILHLQNDLSIFRWRGASLYSRRNGVWPSPHKRLDAWIKKKWKTDLKFFVRNNFNLVHSLSWTCRWQMSSMHHSYWIGEVRHRQVIDARYIEVLLY